MSEPSYDPNIRVADCPDPDASELRRIEVDFGLAVLLTQDEQRRLTLLVDEIASAPWNTPAEGVHWLAGVGSKPHWSRVDAALLGIPAEPDAPATGEPTFDDDVLHLETCARAFVSDKERERTLRRRERPELRPDERSLVQVLAEALGAVAFLDPANDGQVEAVKRRCRKALALLWEREAKQGAKEE